MKIKKIWLWTQIFFFFFLQFICLTAEKMKKNIKVFRCVTHDGKPITFNWFRSWIHIQQKPVLLNSSEGSLIIIHGNSDGTMNYYGQSITISQLAEMLPAGHYNLVACYNGCRKDYQQSGVTIKRVDSTNRHYISVCICMRGNIYCTSSWELHWLNKKIRALKKLV